MIHEAVPPGNKGRRRPPAGRPDGVSRWHSELPLVASPSLPTGRAPASKFIWKALKMLTNCRAQTHRYTRNTLQCKYAPLVH